MLQLADNYLGRDPDGTYSSELEANAVINCVDHPELKPRSAATELADIVRFQAELPPWGGGWAISGCTGMPKPAKGDKLGEVSATGAPPIVVVGTTGDPATPYAGAIAMVAHLAGSELLTFESTEHTAYGTQRSGCIDDAVDAYFVDGALPPVGTPAAQPGSASHPAQSERAGSSSSTRLCVNVPVPSNGIRVRPIRISPLTWPSSHSRSNPTGTRSPTCAVRASSRSSSRKPNASSPKVQCTPGTSHTSSAQIPSPRISSSAPSRGREHGVVTDGDEPLVTEVERHPVRRVVVEHHEPHRAVDTVGLREREPVAFGHQLPSSSRTASRSSTSSAIVAANFAWAKSSWLMPSTTEVDGPSLRTGYPNTSPSGTPYSPALTTARECQSSPGVGVWMLLTESTMACAAEVAND